MNVPQLATVGTVITKATQMHMKKNFIVFRLLIMHSQFSIELI